MPYYSIEDLPESIKNHLPKRAQKIYKRVFNRIWDIYHDPSKLSKNVDRVELAAKIAWTEVKKEYKKKNKKWIKKDKSEINKKIIWDLGHTLIDFKSKENKEYLKFMSCIFGQRKRRTQNELLALNILESLGKQHCKNKKCILLNDQTPAPEIVCKWFEGKIGPKTATKLVLFAYRKFEKENKFKSKKQKQIIYEMLINLFDPKIIAQQFVPIKEMIEILDLCSKNPKNDLYILSNFDRYSFNIFFKSEVGQKIFKYFRKENIVISGRAKLAKPFQNFYDYFLSKYQLQLDNCIFIDNKHENIDEADKEGKIGIYLFNKKYSKVKKELLNLRVL